MAEWLEVVKNCKMEKKTFWMVAGIVIAILLIFVIWQTIQINSLSSAGGSVANTASSAAQSSGGMVGGC